MFRLNPNKTRGAYRAFSGVDIIPVVYAAGETLILGNVQVVSYSVHRETAPVRALGVASRKGSVTGTRTIAGTLVFVDFD